MIGNGGTPKVSFVTPFYNTAKYLRECIESVLRQTYQNWEYVLLNNCSTDESREIAQSYAAKYPEKVRVEDNPKFLSQVQNYNQALRLISADSRYCKVVQADDWLFPDCVKSMVETAELDPGVGIVSAYELAGDEVNLGGLPYPSPRVSGREVCRLYFLKGIYLFGTPTSLLLRTDLVRSRDPFYDERYAPFEDGHACFDLLQTWDFGFVHQVQTYSRRDNDSILLRIRPYRPELLIRLSMLVVHGRKYLSGEEFKACLKETEQNYFRFLASQACARRTLGQDFWKFHQDGLASIGYYLDWRVLGKWMPRAVLRKTWNAWDRIFE